MASNADMIAAFLGGAGYGGRGGGIGDFADLNEFQNTLAKNNYYRLAAVPLLQTKFDTSTWSPVQSFGATALQSFLGSALNSLGQNYEAQQLAKVVPVLGDVYANPAQTPVPEGVDPEAFQQLQMSAIRENALREARDRQADKDLKQRLFGEMFIRNPVAAQQLMPDVAKDFAVKLDLQQMPTQTPVTAMDVALQKFGGDEALAREYVKLTDPEFKAAQLAFDKAEKENTAATGARSISPSDTLTFVTKQFDDAKNLDSIEAALPGTTAANEFAGIQTNLRVKLQQAIGREMNAPEQERLMAALPDWNDTKEQIENKKQRFLELTRAVLKPASASDVSLSPKIDLSAGLPLSTQPASSAMDIKSFIAQAKALGLSKEEARARWAAMGGQ